MKSDSGREHVRRMIVFCIHRLGAYVLTFKQCNKNRASRVSIGLHKAVIKALNNQAKEKKK